MSNYQNEQEQLDAIKSWWNKYGNSLVTVLLLIALSYAGWFWYKSSEEKRLVQASQAYEQLIGNLNSQDDHASEVLAKRIIADFPNTTYADFASLSLAYNAVYHGNLDDAKMYLQRIIEQSKRPEAKQIARIRQARILYDQQQYQQALNILSVVEYTALIAMVEETKGDIYLAQNKLNQAKAAYQIALTHFSQAGVTNQLLQIKAQNVPQDKTLTEEI